ncbi:MAG: hypothetical protein HOC91_03775 [Nitrospinaceae bacterium]|jgi:hypothetical protein|nr:hypothetical protein [Nitrospinaceae bacterium]MBT3432609.1 hypothetical protein [Nitrospinaceae bacterium]MBT3819887.1 hypothetical protein [Nitrospinaceae bacterium]MBT4429612.1 hypothetical protein [Nitrospinaceae bacterium]MBT5366794.1 hypothetical protein [Nitrospinaceae bacterium]
MDFDARFKTLEDKIQRQETRLRLHKRLGLIAMVIVVCAAAFAATRPVADVIEARKFVLKNSQGRTVGIWGADAGGPSFVLMGKERGNLGLRYGEAGPGILLTDSSGKTRLTLGVLKDEKLGDYPVVNLSDPQGRNRITLATQGPKGEVLIFSDPKAGTSSTLGILGGNPAIKYTDHAGINRVSLQLVDKSDPVFSFNDNKGLTRTMLTFSEGVPAFILRDGVEKSRTILTLSDNGDPLISLSDRKERGRIYIGISESNPMIYQKDENGTIRSIVRLTKGGTPWVVHFDEKGKIIWNTPSIIK